MKVTNDKVDNRQDILCALYATGYHANRELVGYTHDRNVLEFLNNTYACESVSDHQIPTDAKILGSDDIGYAYLIIVDDAGVVTHRKSHQLIESNGVFLYSDAIEVGVKCCDSTHVEAIECLVNQLDKCNSYKVPPYKLKKTLLSQIGEILF